MNLQSVSLEKTSRTKPPTAQVVPQLPRDAFDVRKFTENFDVLVDAAGSAKHLRELVLKLAVSGQLSDASNETADSLLAELERQRLRLGKTGVRVGETSPPVTVDETPHAIPSGWRWIRLRDLGGFLGGGTPSKSNASFWEGPLPWVSPKDMKRPHIGDAEDHISTAAVEGSAVKLIPAQSILYVVRGMILAHSFPVAATTREVTINQDMKALVLAMPSLSEFILRSCQAARTRVLAKVERSSHGTCRLESEAVEMLPIALPPLAEQKRIVARVDQLMALIDDLEAKQSKKRDLSTRFTKASVEALATADSPETFDAGWTRVVENFDMLFQRSDAVQNLRDLLLQLAMAGKLLPRELSDGSAKELLDREHQLPVGQKRRRKLFKKNSNDASAANHAAYPEHWAIATVQQLYDHRIIIDYADGNHGSLYPRSADFGEPGVPFVTARNIAGGKVDVLGSPRLLREKACRLTKGWAEGGDVLLTHNATVGRVGIVASDEGRFLLGTSATYYRLNQSALDSRFFAYYLMSPHWQGQLASIMQQTTRNQVSIQKQATFEVRLPPLAEQRRIAARLESMLRECDDLEAKLRRAEDRASKLMEAVVQEMVA